MKTSDRTFETAIRRLMAGDYPAARTAIQQTVRRLRGPSAPSLAGWGLYYLGLLYRERGQGFRAFKLFSEALQRHHALGDSHGQGWALHALGTVTFHGDHWSQAIPLFRKASTMGEYASDAALVAAARNALSRVALLEGRLNKAQQLLAQLTFPLATPLDFTARRVTFQVAITWGRLALELKAGEMATAYATQALELAMQWQDAAAQPELIVLLGEAALQRRTLEAANQQATTALTQARRFGQRYQEAEALLLAGRIALEEGQAARAQETIQGALTLAKRLGARLLRLRVLAALALVCERTRQTPEAMAHARRVLRSLAPRELPRLQGTMHALGRRLAVNPDEQALWKRERGTEGGRRAALSAQWLPSL